MAQPNRKGKKNGSGTKTKPGIGYFRECPECPMTFNAARKQAEPPRYPADVKVCANGHKIQERGGYRL